jgi:hypothetical protein
VHAEHAQPLRRRRRKRAQAHQRRRCRVAGRADKFGDRRAGFDAGINAAAADIEHRPFGAGDQVDRFGDARRIALGLRLVVPVGGLIGRKIFALGKLHVFRQIHHHRSGPPGAGDIECLVHGARQIVDVLHQIIVLGAGPRNARGIGFLEGVVADQVGRHLAGQANHWNAVHKGIGQPGHGVGRAGARRHQNDAGLTGRAGIAFGHVDRPLLVTHQNMANRVLLEQRIVERQHRTAGIAENNLNALIRQGLDDHFRTRHSVPRHHLKTFPIIPTGPAPTRAMSACRPTSRRT